MRFIHVIVCLANLVVLAALIIGSTTKYPSALAFGIVGGYFANLIAIAVALILALALAIRVPSGTALITLRRQWLGLANGVAVVLAWSVYFAVGKMSWQ